MGQSDNPDQPDAGSRRRTDQARSFLNAITTAVRLPPDLLVTWRERVLAVVAIALVVWMVVDMVRQGL
jgi:hypothetical protein